MDIFLVGGAVRDRLLGLTVTERDWVVVGGTPGELEALGYRQVGRDFPVFLHPETGDEYALARTERKRGRGHRGFEVDSDPSVTLEEDLLRRDLTINAIAETETGELIDPHGGRRDLEARLLRHVSNAFVEDPLRVLRVARFAARLSGLGFTIAPDTLALMREISDSGELETLSAERLWSETERALGSDAPGVFLSVLEDCGAASRLLPELVADSGKLQRRLALATEHSPGGLVRFAAMTTGLNDDDVLRLCERLHAPRRFSDLARLWAALASPLGEPSALDAAARLAVLEQADAFRRPERFDLLLEVLESQQGAGAGDFWRSALAACEEVDAASIAATGIPGHEVGARLKAEREAKLAALL